MTSRQITWYPPAHTGLDPIVLTDRAAGYRVLKGSRGLGEVEHQLVTDASVWSDGDTVDADYALPRAPMLPMLVTGADRDEYLTRIRALAAAMRTRAPGGRPAPGELELAQHDGRRFRLRCHYRTGLPDHEEIDVGGDTTWARFGLQLYAPDPFWYAADPVTLSWESASPVAFLGADFLPLRISRSSVLGPTEIVNPGSEAALGVWRVTGPGSDFIATNEASGEVLRVTESIPGGQVLTIVTDPTIADISLQPAGTDWWDNLVDGSALWEIPPGTTSIDLTLTGATADSEIVLEFYPRYGAPW
ncbi:phage tail family protein [Saccharothrix stipae]